MTRLTDGPGAGQALMLKRSPIFLRVTRKRFKLEAKPEPHQKADVFDALDAPEDTPAPDEELFCYIQSKQQGNCHIRLSGKAKSSSGFYPVTEYSLYSNQPPDEIMRDTALWREWCRNQAGLHNRRHKEP